jgi:AbrB family looped-hinge helix DNA binding protein
MFTVKLSSKNQITVPGQVRRQLRIGSGDRICFEAMQDGRFVVTSVATAARSDGAARRRLRKAGEALSPSSMDALIGASVLSDDQRIKRGAIR